MRLPMRLSALLWLLVFIVAAGYVIRRLLVFKQIFFEHSGIPVTQQGALESYRQSNGSGTQLIPKIIHQVFHNWKDPGIETLPADWSIVRQTCIDTNPGWKHKLWTEKSSRDFIEREYPWFLGTYDGYRYPVQRVDAVRYFLLMHYGGIYLDLDNGCKTDLTPLLYYPTWVTDGGRGALSNNVLASSPHHPFWTRLTMSLVPWDYNWIFPYVTISYASGQWFETAIWEEYHSLLPRPDKSPDLEHRLYRLMMDDRDGADPWVFFTQERGGTWINWDNRMFLIIGDHLGLFFLVLAGAVACVGWTALRMKKMYSNPYSRLRNASTV